MALSVSDNRLGTKKANAGQDSRQCPADRIHIGRAICHLPAQDGDGRQGAPSVTRA